MHESNLCDFWCYLNDWTLTMSHFIEDVCMSARSMSSSGITQLCATLWPPESSTDGEGIVFVNEQKK